MTCEPVRDLLPDLALGFLTGQERAAAIVHLEGCPACQTDLEHLSAVVDGVVALAPEADPPVGFESRVAARLAGAVPIAGSVPIAGAVPAAGAVRGARRGRRTWRVPVPVLAVGAAAALVLAGAGGWEVGHRGGPVAAVAAGPRSAELVGLVSHRPMGQVVLTSDSHNRWLYMTVDAPGVEGSVACDVVGPGGRDTTLGWFDLSRGYGFWASPIPAGAATVSGARLVGPSGSVLAVADLTRA